MFFKLKTKIAFFAAFASLAALSLLSGCGGGGGGGGENRGQPVIPITTPAATPISGSAIVTGKLAGRLMISTGRSTARRAADPFLLKIPANTPQSLVVPDTGYESLASATVTITSDGKDKTAKTDNNGNFVIADVPEGTQLVKVTGAGNGNDKDITIPITVTGGKDNNELSLISEDPTTGQLVADTQIIHGDGTDGYKKESSTDNTSDTVFVDGIRDHHLAAGTTQRDLTDDGIVDQTFPDPDDDGKPNGPVKAAGGETVATAVDPSAQVNNTAPEIKTINSKDNKGKNADTVMAGDTLTLSLDSKDTESGNLKVKWTVEDAMGNDLTSLYLDNPDIVAPTFSPPAGEFTKPGGYIVKATLTDPEGLATEKDIILSVDTPGNKAPHASIKANHTAGEAPLTVDFTCDAFDKDGTVVKYCWDMDKSNGVKQDDCDDSRVTITKTFISEGKYRVTCIVTDDKGATGFDMRVVVVRKKVVPPVITKFTPDKTTVAPGEKVRVAFAANDPDGATITVAFTPAAGTMTDSNYSDGFIEWTAPSTPGDYTIDAEVTDPDGATDRKTINITVEAPGNKTPTITATADPSTGENPLNVSLSATATDPDGDPLTVTWDFDDSDGIQTDATGATATVKFGGPGDYYATAKACDNKGACSSEKVKITVTQASRPPYITNASPAAPVVEVGDPVALNARAFDDDNDQLTYKWTVSDGTLSSATDSTPIWTVPTTPGEYSATVTVSDGKTAPVTKTTTITVLPETPDKRPLPPARCGVTAGSGSALLKWNASPSDDVDHFKLTRSSGGVETTVADNISRTAFSYNDTALSNGATYDYNLVAIDADGFASDKCADDMRANPQPELTPPIDVGDEPGNGEYDSGSDKIFIPIKGDDQLVVTDPGTGAIIKKIPVDDQPVYVCVDPERKRVYITCSGDDILSVVDTATLAVIARIPVGDKPETCAVNPENGDIYVGNNGSDDVSVVDPITQTEKKKIGAGTDPVVCDVSDKNNLMFVTSGPDRTVGFIDTNTLNLTKTVNTSSAPAGCVINDDRDELFVPLPGPGDIIVVNPPGGEIESPPIHIGGSPECKCTVNKTSNQIYITNKIKRTMTLINGNTRQPEREITLPVEPIGTCGVDPVRNKICVPNKKGGAISLINNPLPAYPVDPITPKKPEYCSAAGKNNSVGLSWKDHTYCITIYPPPLDCVTTGFKIRRGTSASGPFTLIASVGENPKTFTDLAVTNGTKYYYQIATVRASGNESEVCQTDATPEGSVDEIITLPAPPEDGSGKTPCCSAHDEVRNIYYIANEETNTVDVIDFDTHTLIKTIVVADCCGDIVHNKITNKTYITNKTTNKLTVINGTDYTVEEQVEIPGAGNGKCEINETTNEIYITNDIENELIIYNPGTRIVIKVPIPGPPACPCDVVVNKITNEIFVTNKTTNKLTIINGTDYTVIEQVEIGGSGGPGSCVINEKTNTIYMTNETTNEMIAYNRKAERIVKRINVGVKPVCKPCGVDETTNQVFVTNQESNTISLIDGATNSVIKTIPVGHNPISAAVMPNNQLAVFNTGDNNLTVINNPLPSTPSDTAAPSAPTGVMASSASGTVTLTWAANSDSGLAYYSVYRKIDGAAAYGSPLKTTIDNTYTDTAATGAKYIYAVTASDNSANESPLSNSVAGRANLPTEITVGSYPAAAVSNDALGRVYVTNRDSNTLSIIDANTNSLIGNFPVSLMPLGLDVDTTTGRVYVANFGGTTVSVINGSTGALIKSVTTGGTALSSVAVDETSGMYYVTHANLSLPIVVPFTTAADTKGVPIVTRPGSLGVGIVEPTSHAIYVANSLDGSVSVITPSGMTGTATPTLAIDSQPTDVVAASEALNSVAVSCGGTAKVAIINNTTRAITYIPVGLSPSGMGVDKSRNLIYVANTSSGTVSVIDASLMRVIGEINVGGDPTDVAVNATLNKIFVTLKTSGKVIVRDGL